MGLFKLLILALVVWLIWRGVKHFKARQVAVREASQHNAQPTQGGKMKVCNQCGVHYPPETGVIKNGQDYCSAACANKA